MELVTNSTTARVDGEVLCSTPLDSAGTAALIYYHTHCLQMTCEYHSIIYDIMCGISYKIYGLLANVANEFAFRITFTLL